MTNQQSQPKFASRVPVDFVVIGSGAAGGVIAKELSTAGFDIVVLEQGPYMKPHQFRHDEFGDNTARGLGLTFDDDPQTFRTTEDEEAVVERNLLYLKMVGGTSVHFTANYWRFHPVDFKERSLLGPISGTGFDDWPITYEELEPYYTKVDWEVGVSGVPGVFRSAALASLPDAAAAGEILRRVAGTRGQKIRLARLSRADGYSLATTQQPPALHPLRLLHAFRL